MSLKSYKNQRGEKVVISKMTDEYLVNAFNFFSKKLKKFSSDTDKYYVNNPGPQGEMAQDLFEDEFENRLQLSNYLSELISALGLEIAERGIKI